jgi:myosin heavy subunit
MEEIKRQVGRARRRLIGEQFLTIAIWSLFSALLVGAIALAVPKIWALPLEHNAWMYGWLGGSLTVGLLVAIVWTYAVRRSSIEAAIELDRRFGLKERVSSTLALNQEELSTDIGRALVADAIRKVERVDVREQFRLQPTWRVALPLIPAAVMAGLFFVPNANLEKKASASSTTSAEQRKKMVKAAEILKKKLETNQKKAETDPSLKDAQLLKEISKKVTDLAQKEGLEKKEIQIKINDMAKEIEERKRELGGAKEMQKQLDKLGKIEKGPADKLADAMKNGDFKEAQKQLEKMKEDLKAGKLDEKDKEQLAKQLEQMKDKLQQMAQDQKEAREQVAREIEKKLAEGDREGAAKLQEKLDKMEKEGQKMEQMAQKMASKLGQCAECMKQGGDPKEAGEKLDDLAKSLKEAQEQLDQMENLDDVLDQLADAKEAMSGKDGNTRDGQQMDGDLQGNQMSKGNKQGNKRGPGMGSGRGEGERPEEEVDTKTYDSQVAGKPKAGEAVRTGDAGGKNIAGKTLQEIKAEMQSSLAKDPDALNEQNLPRELQNQSRQYFQKFRKGE